jgi:integral membrane sensor domain MASE1
MYWLQQTFTLRALNARNAALIVLTAASYFVAARVSQVFAIDPGNITPVWIPSGIMLALALKYGARFWPGVFIGAFLGNVGIPLFRTHLGNIKSICIRCIEWSRGMYCLWS